MQPSSTSSKSWQQPLTATLAVFVDGPVGHLLLLQLVVAAIASSAVLWVFSVTWMPVIEEAVSTLPKEGQLRSGALVWKAGSPMRLAGNRFLTLAVDLDQSRQYQSAAHIYGEFGMTSLRVFSLVGGAELPYPRGWIIAFNRTDLEPAWGAWKPAILAGITLGSMIWLLAIWTLLSALYAPLVTLAGFYLDRRVNLWRSWKLSGVALMPGALLMTAAVLFYGAGIVDLLHFITISALHLVIGWICIVCGMFLLPRVAPSLKRNPFKRGLRESAGTE